jgi:hypothetical protein
MTQGQRIATFVGATAFAFGSLVVVKQVYAKLHGIPKAAPGARTKRVSKKK